MPEKAGCVGIKKVWNLKSRNKKLNRETVKKQTNKQSQNNFERNLGMMVMYLPIKFDFDWTNHFKLESGNQQCYRMNKMPRNG